jgi:hypothetical protein
MKNESVTQIEALGEWDHGMCDPVFDDQIDDSGSDGSIDAEDVDIASSCRKLVGSIVSVEQALEGAVRLAILKMERRVEGLFQRQAREQDVRQNQVRSSI